MRQDRQLLYILAQLTSSNHRWYTSLLYLRNDDGGLPPYTRRIVGSCPERWKYGVPKDDQPKLQPLLEALERLRGHSLTAAVVVAAFHRRRVLPLMARRQRLFEMTPSEPIDGIRLSAVALSNEEVLRRVRETVEGWLRSSGLTPFPMRPSRGYITLVSHALLPPPRPSCSSPFSVPLLAFAIPIGDESRASLPTARSRGRRAVGGEPGACRGIEEEERCGGGKAQEEEP